MFCIVSDTSDPGAVIFHSFPDSSHKAISHALRSLTPAERNYGQIEKKVYAIVFT